jgi:dihydroorotase
MKILLKQGRILDPAMGTDRIADLLIVDGMIEKIGKISPIRDADVYDLHGKIVAPGFCDMHVHLREPGYEYKETIETGTRAAASGGFTAICCMPNTQPAIDDASVLKSILQTSKNVNNGIVDVYPIAAITKGREGKELSPMIELAMGGAVAFSDDGAPVMDAEVMRRAFEYAGMINRTIIQHAEDISMSKGGVMNEGIMSTRLGLPGIPSIAEEVVIARDIHLLGYTGGKYHVAHISTQGSLVLIKHAKREGLPITCEVTPHHFTLTEEAVATYDTNFKMNPPLRGVDDIEAMKTGLRDGTIDVIATDHAPHSFDDKEVEFQYAPFGIVGLETAIGLAISGLVGKNYLTIEQLIEKFSVNPRRILSLPVLRILEGEPANITILDPDREWIVDIQRFRSKSKNSPFQGWKLKGSAMGIINNGSIQLNR